VQGIEKQFLEFHKLLPFTFRRMLQILFLLRQKIHVLTPQLGDFTATQLN